MSKIKSAYWDTITSLEYKLQELPDDYCYTAMPRRDKLLAKQFSNEQYLKERLKTPQETFLEVKQYQRTTELRKRLRERFKGLAEVSTGSKVAV